MIGDGHIYIVYDANGRALRRHYRMRIHAKDKADKIGGTVGVIPNAVRRKENAEEKPKEEKEAEAPEEKGEIQGEAEL